MVEPHGERPKSQSEPANLANVKDAPFSVVAELHDVQAARVVVEDLEEHGIPTSAISLQGVETDSPGPAGRNPPESRAFASVSKSVIVGGAGGAAVGALLGIAMVAFAVPELGWAWGAALGALFGSAIGGAAGGMSVVKYASPAWQESYQAADTEEPFVVVSHAEESVIDSAAEIISRHEPIVASVARFENGSPTS